MHSENSERPPLRFLLLSHHSSKKLSHTLHIPLRGHDVYLCARCSGILTGFLIGLLYVDLLIATFAAYPILIGILTVPAAVDWFFQVFKRKESTNFRRILTGSLHGQLYAAGLVALVRGLPVISYFVAIMAIYFVAMYVVFKYTRGFSEYVRKEWQ